MGVRADRLNVGRAGGDARAERAFLSGWTPTFAEQTSAREKGRSFDTFLSDLTMRFLDLPPESVDQTIQETLQSLACTLSLESCGVAQFADDGRSLRWTQGFAVPGLRGRPISDLSSALPWYTGQVRRGRTLVFSHLPKDLPREATAEAELVAASGLKSTVTLPLRAGGVVLGCLGIGNFSAFREWTPEFVSSMELLTSVFANALQRRRSEERLRAAEGELERTRTELERMRVELLELRDRVEAEGGYPALASRRVNGTDGIVGTSVALTKTLRQIEQVAGADSPVLILGETGTGKDLVARSLHERSRRSKRPLVIVNCAALPDALIESELFGYEKGAFTGAVARTMGRFEAAHGGSILLDEIGELPLGVQAKLLRVLEGGTFERLGSAKTISVDVRVIAATNRDLEKEVREGRFRADLYYRLNVFPITVPSLRERAEDIPLLAWHFINAKQGMLGRAIERVPERVMKALTRYPWPGNVRELENLIERALIVTSGSTLAMDAPFLEGAGGRQAAAGTSLDEVQRAHIEEVLRQCDWKVSGKGNAAERLGLKRGTLQFRMKKLRIERQGTGSGSALRRKGPAVSG